MKEGVKLQDTARVIADDDEVEDEDSDGAESETPESSEEE